MTDIEQEYRVRLSTMSVAEKVARSQAMFLWSREVIAKQISEEHPEYSSERLKWEVAARIYADEPETMKLVERMLERVSHRSL
jgi:hypothetical protein